MKDIRTDLLLNGNEIIDVKAENVSSDPTGSNGRIIYNTTDNLLKYFNGTEWVSLEESSSNNSSPERVITVGESGTDFGLDSTSTPITDAINSITPAASSSARWLIKIYPGEYDENITLPEYVSLEGSGESSIISPTSGSAISFSNPSNGGICDISNLKVECTDASCLNINNTGLEVNLNNCNLISTFNTNAASDRNTISINGGVLKSNTNNVELIDTVSGNANTIYDSCISVNGTSLSEVEMNSCALLTRATNSSLHNVVAIKGENTNSSTKGTFNGNTFNVISEASNTEVFLSAITLDSSRGIYEVNNNTIIFDVPSTGSGFTGFLGFVHNSIGGNNTILKLNNNSFDCKNIDSDKLFVGSGGTQYDSTYVFDTNVFTDTDFYFKRYNSLGTAGIVEYEVRNNFGRVIPSRIKTFNVSAQFATRFGNWGNFNWNDFFRWKTALAVLQLPQWQGRNFVLNLFVPSDCNEIISLYSVYIPISNPTNSATLTYNSTISQRGVNESSWSDGNTVTFTNPSRTLNLIHEDDITGIIPSNLREDLANECIGIRMDKSSANFEYRFIGFKLEYL